MLENELTLIILGVFSVIFIAIATKKRINLHEYHINCVDKVSLKSYGDIIRIFFIFNRQEVNIVTTFTSSMTAVLLFIILIAYKKHDIGSS